MSCNNCGDAYDEGYSDGKTDGNNEGYDRGYEDGRESGLEEGREDGEVEGRELGFDTGWEQCCDDNDFDELVGNDTCFRSLLWLIASQWEDDSHLTTMTYEDINRALDRVPYSHPPAILR